MGKRNDAFKEVQQSWANILDYRLPITYDLKSPLTPTIDELRQRGWSKPGSELGLPIPVPLWYLTGKSFDQRVPLLYLPEPLVLEIKHKGTKTQRTVVRHFEVRELPS